MREEPTETEILESLRLLSAPQALLYFQNLADECKSEKICLMAVKRNPHMITYVPQHVLTVPFYEQVIVWEGWIINRVNPADVTDVMRMNAVKQDPWLIKKIDLCYRTDELYLAAIDKEPLLLDVIPSRLLTQEMCEWAVKKDGYALESVPNKFITEAMCIEAINDNVNVILSIDNEFKTEAVLLAGMVKSTKTFYDIPSSFFDIDAADPAAGYKKILSFLSLIEQANWQVSKSNQMMEMHDTLIDHFNGQPELTLSDIDTLDSLFEQLYRLFIDATAPLEQYLELKTQCIERDLSKQTESRHKESTLSL